MWETMVDAKDCRVRRWKGASFIELPYQSWDCLPSDYQLVKINNCACSLNHFWSDISSMELNISFNSYDYVDGKTFAINGIEYVKMKQHYSNLKQKIKTTLIKSKCLRFLKQTSAYCSNFVPYLVSPYSLHSSHSGLLVPHSYCVLFSHRPLHNLVSSVWIAGMFCLQPYLSHPPSQLRSIPWI